MIHSHDGSLLDINNMVCAVPDGAYLFPFNGRVFDTTNSIPILKNENTTYRDDECKFMGSVAVESGTTNEASIYYDSGGMDTVTPPPIESPYSNEIAYHISSGEWYGVGVTPSNRTLNVGESISFSAYVFIPQACTAMFNLQMDSTEVNNYGCGTRVIEANKSGWHRLEWNGITRASTQTNITFRIENSRPANGYWSIASNECWMTAFQIERKDHCTSFIPAGTSRGNGRLMYDISSLNIRDRCSVSFWMKNSYHMMNSDDFGFYFVLCVDGVNKNHHSMFIGKHLNGKQFRYGIIDSPDDGIGNGDKVFNLTKNTTDFAEGEWINVCVQWDKDGLPSGNSMEFYMNGYIAHSTKEKSFSTKAYNQIDMSWGGIYSGDTQYEQLVISPSKTLTEKEVYLMYKSNAPLYDWRDQILFY